MPNYAQSGGTMAGTALGGPVGGAIGGALGNALGGILSGLGGSKATIRRRNAGKLWDGSSELVKRIMTKDEALALAHPERTTEYLINTWIPAVYSKPYEELLRVRSTGEQVDPDPNKPATGQWEAIALDRMISSKNPGSQSLPDLPGGIGELPGAGDTNVGAGSGTTTTGSKLSLAGIPIWAIVLLIGVAVFMIFGNKKG
jgi:hypothetical protein